ncbi:hypothetical protein M378DRAFT_189851 [Amanita muscaria Koide BX008]|uniref:Ribosome biogenesis regulatory protein n=1 Tax=Amanita muscaria (strain Koide BX008) TaxID=946122 RepID=A0A0C2T363_AMAMK|nr:hypothetical protein M378DRAFT_189851 [Amanita muscaria Koide BX008]
MDVSDILASHAAKFQATTVEKDIHLDADPGCLAVSDLNPIDEESYNLNLEEHLQTLARDGTQVLINALFSLPTTSSPDGPLAQLPPPVFQLPRAKPLPKPKPPTKWELFAKAKGIQKKRKEKRVWDEEKQEWVNRWGKGGKNKQVEDQWITEVPHNAEVNFDPRKEARDERKVRIAKNEKQQQQNLARQANPRETRKREIERDLVQTRISTASMGRFDKQLEGEKKPHGIKRKFNPTEENAEDERKASLALLSKIESDAKKMRKDPQREDNIVNVRKAIRHASKGKGALAMAGKSDGKGNKRKGKR